MTDLMRPNSRDISPMRAVSLFWLKGEDATEKGIANFKSREGLPANSEFDLLFMGGDMIKGIGYKIASELDSLTDDSQNAIVEWAANDRPLFNVGEIVNAFYRPQVVVPGGLKIPKNQFSLRRPPAY